MQHYAQRRADRLGRAGGGTVTSRASGAATCPRRASEPRRTGRSRMESSSSLSGVSGAEHFGDQLREPAAIIGVELSEFFQDQPPLDSGDERLENGRFDQAGMPDRKCV